MAKILEKAGLHPVEQRAALRGITDDALVYEIPLSAAGETVPRETAVAVSPF